LSTAEPGARPGDVTTHAITTMGGAVLDVTIVSQDAGHAGADCTVTAYRRKLRRYATTIASWDGTGRTFRPMVWSQEGRPHAQTEVTLRGLAKAIAQKRGGSSTTALRRIKAEISVAVALRRSRCIQRCLPPLTRDQWFAWFGTRDEEAQMDPWGGTLTARLARDDWAPAGSREWYSGPQDDDQWEGDWEGEDLAGLISF